MFYLVVSIILLFILPLLVNKIFSKGLLERENGIRQLHNEHSSLLTEESRLKEQNTTLEESTQETIALYDLTKDICNTLDEKKILKIFSQRIGGFLKAEDCRFIKGDAEVLEQKNYTALPLLINKNVVGHLVARGVKEQDEEKFHILARQFLIGIKRAILYEKVQQLTITDPLTRIFNRRYFLERLNEEFSRSQKFNYNFAFLMIDVDHFKDINDNFGHLVGDAILREVSKVIKEKIRQVDFMGRYGGEELSIVLTQTDKSQAGFAAERIRQSVESREFRVYDEALKVTISAGISSFPDSGRSIPELIDKADKALYKSKQEGRNRVFYF